jgi:uncharacterized membrane protein YfcA
MLKKLIFLSIYFITGFLSTNFMSPCKSNDFCVKSYNSEYSCVEGHCHHSPFFPLDNKRIFAAVTILLVSAIAGAGGIGGGMLLIPVYCFVLNFTIGDSIPLSKVTIFSGAVINMMLTYNERLRNDPNTLTINYKLIGFLIPLILAGTMLGISLTKLLPSVLIFSCLVGYLFVSVVKTYKKARELHLEENAEKVIAEPLIEVSQELFTVEEKKWTEKENFKEQEYKNFKINRIQDQSIKTFKELILPNRSYIIISFLIYFLILLVALIRGGDGFKSLIGLDSCSMTSWFFFIFVQGICFLASYNVYKNELQKEVLFVETEKNSDKGTNEMIDVTSDLLSKLYFNSYLAGVLAGTLGLGGGLVINPVLLKEKFSPEVAAGVSGLVVFFTSLSTSTQFIIAGAFDFNYAIYIILLSGIGSFIGHYIFQKIMDYYQKPSILVWVLFSFMLLSCLTLPPVGAWKIANQSNAFSFGVPC